jgi:protein-disulfide isomerase
MVDLSQTFRADRSAPEFEATVEVADEDRVHFPTEGLPRKGAESRHARVEMVVCSDFGCPYSKRAAGTVDELLADNGDLSFHHANLPIGVWKDSELKALASIAAQRQGQFWPMHDALFDAHFESADDAITLARQLGLDEGRFALDLLDPSIHAELRRQQHLCAAAGVRAVPTFFINGRRVVGSVPRHDFQRVIDEERRRVR